MKKSKPVKIIIPTVFRPLLKEKIRYKLYYGGRAGGKSYAFADSLLLKGRMEKLFIVCVREIQESIKESVYKLLSDRIETLGLTDYKIFQRKIENSVTGTRIIFKGLRDQDAGKIKSLEGADLCWIEEGQSITKKSWDILDPTIRKENSEIWISMNREAENDALWTVLGAHPDKRTLVRKVNYTDNPFCPEEIKLQAQKCLQTRPLEYPHIWLGEPKKQADMALISSDVVLKAFEVKMFSSSSPLVIGVDIARFGSDKTALFYRKGRYGFKIEFLDSMDTVEVANHLTAIIKTCHPTRIFLDLGNTGAGVYDILKDRGYGEIIRGVNFGAKAFLADRYVNKRAEMWDAVRCWLSAEELPVQLPKSDVLLEDLIGIQKKYDTYGRLQLESKEDIRKRLGRSPDIGDALALTFAEPVKDLGEPKLYDSGKVYIEDLFKQKKKMVSW